MPRCSRPNFLSLLMLVLLGAPLACLETVGPAEGPLPLPENESGRRDLTFTFGEEDSGWNTGYADFDVGQDPEDIQFRVQRIAMPSGTDRQERALFISSMNVNDDLFTFLYTRVGRLKPNTPYALTFELELASNAPRRCSDVYGAPGEDVFLKVGASIGPPLAAADSTTRIRLNLDKGNQSVGGANAQVLGDISTELEQCFNTPYRVITRDNRGNPFRITTDDQGQLWLLVGTDSDYRGTTALYYDTLHVVLEPS
jgi:hypothetical protein